MNYGQVRDAALHLLNQYSVAGREIPASYNNQQDYLSAIPSLIDSAQMEIATTVKPISALKNVRADSHGLFPLPCNCYRFIGTEPRRDFRFVGERHFIVPGWKGSRILVEYHRYPHPMGENPEDDKRLDNTPDTHYAIPYYVASRLVLDDDTYKQATLYNEWRTRLTELMPPVRVEKGPQFNVYANAIHE